MCAPLCTTDLYFSLMTQKPMFVAALYVAFCYSSGGGKRGYFKISYRGGCSCVSSSKKKKKCDTNNVATIDVPIRELNAMINTWKDKKWSSSCNN